MENMADPIEYALRADLEKMTDNQVVDRAASYNAQLRKGRKMQADGEVLLRENINLFVMCQNELHSRMHRRIELETNREMQKDQ
jgi:hypothetical protein